MIVPSKRLRQFIDAYPEREILCKQIEIDETTLSRLMTQDRGASVSLVEKVCRFTGWPMGDAWDIVEDKEDA